MNPSEIVPTSFYGIREDIVHSQYNLMKEYGVIPAWTFSEDHHVYMRGSRIVCDYKYNWSNKYTRATMVIQRYLRRIKYTAYDQEEIYDYMSELVRTYKGYIPHQSYSCLMSEICGRSGRRVKLECNFDVYVDGELTRIDDFEVLDAMRDLQRTIEYIT